MSTNTPERKESHNPNYCEWCLALADIGLLEDVLECDELPTDERFYAVQELNGLHNYLKLLRKNLAPCEGIMAFRDGEWYKNGG